MRREMIFFVGLFLMMIVLLAVLFEVVSDGAQAFIACMDENADFWRCTNGAD